MLYEHQLRQSVAPVAVEFADVVAELHTTAEEDPALLAETQQRVRELEHALAQLTPKARAALVLHRRDGFSIEEIATQLGISRNVAKKHLAKGLLRCRQLLEGE